MESLPSSPTERDDDDAVVSSLPEQTHIIIIIASPKILFYGMTPQFTILHPHHDHHRLCFTSKHTKRRLTELTIEE